MTRALGTLPATDAARTIEEVADLVVYATQAFVTTGSALREGGLKPIVEYAADVRRVRTGWLLVTHAEIDPGPHPLMTLPETEECRHGKNKTVVVTGASQGIGAAVVQAFLGRDYNVVATSRSVSKAGFAPSPNLALVDGDIGQAATAANIAKTAISKFGSIDSLVNNAGAFLVKPFMDYTAEDLRSLVSTNLEGFFFVTQLAVKQMLSQGAGGSVTSLTASLAQHPIAGLPASISMLTKGGLNAITVSLASEYAKNNIRFNAVAPGAVDTPIVKGIPKDFLVTLSPMGAISEAKDIADAVIYLTEARHITGEVLHVDGGMHVGKW